METPHRDLKTCKHELKHSVYQLVANTVLLGILYFLTIWFFDWGIGLVIISIGTVIGILIAILEHRWKDS